jgi:hypothetical protein
VEAIFQLAATPSLPAPGALLGVGAAGLDRVYFPCPSPQLRMTCEPSRDWPATPVSPPHGPHDLGGWLGCEWGTATPAAMRS